VLITAPDDPTADPDALDLAALRTDPFVCLPAGTGLHTLLQQRAAAAGFTAHVQSPSKRRASRDCVTSLRTGAAWR
jgi:LysR family transcriptional activator of glutamate synthase operon